MNSKLFRAKLLKLENDLKVAIQAEFEITGLQKIANTWNTALKDLVFPETGWEDSIVAISKNGAIFKTIGFQRWNKFYNYDDLVVILEFLEQFNQYLNSDNGPVTWDIAKTHYFDARDIYDPEQYLWSILVDEDGNEIYFPACKLKKIKSGNKN
jgi:hypothetical protein